MEQEINRPIGALIYWSKHILPHLSLQSLGSDLKNKNVDKVTNLKGFFLVHSQTIVCM